MRASLITLMTCLIAIPAYATYSGGTGEPNDPYQIATADDLMLLGETPEDYDRYFVLTADIDLDPNLPGRKVFDRAVIAADVNYVTYSWGLPASEGEFFTGVFDGNGHTIVNLTIAGRSYLGLFGQLGDGAVITNLGLDTVVINGTGDRMGGFAGSNDRGNITMCYSTGTIIGVGEDVGGLVGSNFGRITASYCIVLGGSRVSGLLVGQNSTPPGGRAVPHYPGFITNCYGACGNSDTVKATGLIGVNWAIIGVEVLNCFWDAQTCGLEDNAQGGTPKTTAEMQMANTFYGWGRCGTEPIWTIDEGNDYPRLYWENKPGEILKPVFLSGFLSGAGTEDDPYLIYTAEDLDLVSLAWCDWDRHFKLMADIDLDPNLAGRTVYDTAVIAPDTDPHHLGFRGTPFTGVFDGNGHTIAHLTIRGVNNLGLFGQLGSGAIVMNLGLEAMDIDGGTGDSIGGLVGSSNRGSISMCFCTGTVKGYTYIGGLMGSNWWGSITASYSMCAATGHRHVGGLVGGNYGGTISNSYSTGKVIGGGDYGACGLLGFDLFSDSVTSSFWDTETSGQDTSAGGIGKTTGEMQTVSTFLEAGWDFVGETANGTDDIWWILEGWDYPRLWWELISGN